MNCEIAEIGMYTLEIKVTHQDPNGKIVASVREATISDFRDAISLLMGATSAVSIKNAESYQTPNTGL